MAGFEFQKWASAAQHDCRMTRPEGRGRELFCLRRGPPIPSLRRANSSGIRRGISPREGTGASCPSRARIIAATASRSPRARPSEALGWSIFVRLGASCVVGGREANDESAARHSDAVSPAQRSSHSSLYRPTECVAMFARTPNARNGTATFGGVVLGRRLGL